MKKLPLTILLMLAVLVACGGNDAVPTEVPAAELPAATAAAPRTITLMSHDSFNISEEVLAQFEAANNATVVLLPSGDTGSALNQAILAKDAPLADVFFGVDNSFLSRALAAELFAPYQSPLLADVDQSLILDPTYRLLPIDYGDVCLNFDKSYFAENSVPVPQSLADLTDPAYRGLLVVQNPATSSPGLAFLLATIAVFGTDGDYTYIDYWTDLRANDLLVTNGWEDAYYGHFTVASTGERPLVVSYASSPVAEFIFADPPVEEPPSGTVAANATCFRQIEFAGILQGTDNRELAESLIDFMLDATFQEDIPLNMFVYPANQEVGLPEAFVRWTEVPAETAVVSPADIEANREAWIEAWTTAVLR